MNTINSQDTISDDIRKPLTVTDFISLSAIYEVINLNRFIINDDLQGEYTDNIRTDLHKIYALIYSAVIFKDGTTPKHWDIPLSDCDVSMSYNTIREILSIIDNLKAELQVNYSYLNKIEQMISHNLNETSLEIHLDCLMELIIS
jgi:hypothetical protein